MRRCLLLCLVFVAACEGQEERVIPVFSGDTSEPPSSEPSDTDPVEPGVALSYNARCKQDAPGSEIADATGTFLVEGPADAPAAFGVGTWVSGTGSLEIYTCVPSGVNEILDRLNFDIELVLFDIDDQPIDLPVSDDATTVNVLWGTASDWDDVTSWTGTGGFMHFRRGGSSFSELDKDGRLVGTIDVTETDPPGHPMTVTIDLTW